MSSVDTPKAGMDTARNSQSGLDVALRERRNFTALANLRVTPDNRDEEEFAEVLGLLDPDRRSKPKQTCAICYCAFRPLWEGQHTCGPDCAQLLVERRQRAVERGM